MYWARNLGKKLERPSWFEHGTLKLRKQPVIGANRRPDNLIKSFKDTSEAVHFLVKLQTDCFKFLITDLGRSNF